MAWADGHVIHTSRMIIPEAPGAQGFHKGGIASTFAAVNEGIVGRSLGLTEEALGPRRNGDEILADCMVPGHDWLLAKLRLFLVVLRTQRDTVHIH